MSLLSPRLQLKVAQKQIVTNPVLEEATEENAEEVTAEEILSSLETDRMDSPADQQILESTNGTGEHAADIVAGDLLPEPNLAPEAVAELAEGVAPLDTV